MSPEEMEKMILKEWNDKKTEIDRNIELAVEKLRELNVDLSTLQDTDVCSDQDIFTFELVQEALLDLIKLRVSQYELHSLLRDYKIKKVLAILGPQSEDDLSPTIEDEEPDEN